MGSDRTVKIQQASHAKKGRCEQVGIGTRLREEERFYSRIIGCWSPKIPAVFSLPPHARATIAPGFQSKFNKDIENTL